MNREPFLQGLTSPGEESCQPSHSLVQDHKKLRLISIFPRHLLHKCVFYIVLSFNFSFGAYNCVGGSTEPIIYKPFINIGNWFKNGRKKLVAGVGWLTTFHHASAFSKIGWKQEGTFHLFSSCACGQFPACQHSAPKRTLNHDKSCQYSWDFP